MDRTLTIEDLDQIQEQLQPAQYQWAYIGLALGLKVPVIDGLSDELRESDNQKRLRGMLKAVLSDRDDVTLREIVEVLRSPLVEQNYLAHKLLEYYIQALPEPAAGGKRQRGASGDPPPETSKRAKTDYTRSANYSSDDPDIVPLSEFQYEMNSREALIINISEFSDPEMNRAGSKQDEISLCKMLVTLGYKVHVERNLNSDEIIPAIFKHANGNKTCDSFICCILTHGNEGVIIGSDENAVKIEDIAPELNKVEQLLGHPKIFFFQACRGDKLKGATQADCASTKSKEVPKLSKEVPKLPPDSDYFYGFASAYGTPAIRNEQSGSYYIQALCKIMQSQYEDEDLSTMVTRVHYKVVKEEIFVEKKKHQQQPQKYMYQQQPQLVSTLRKRVHF